uniref:Uncharacterized protein n=1 Tax=Arundo donax TaxID=35708 RepID=A0A0A9FL64_ARUDO
MSYSASRTHSSASVTGLLHLLVQTTKHLHMFITSIIASAHTANQTLFLRAIRLSHSASTQLRCRMQSVFCNQTHS